MSRVILIGGSGHVGTFLVPRLVAAGHQVVNVSRGRRSAYQPSAAWAQVETVAIDRDSEEQEGSFGQSIAALGGDIVIDMICFTPESCRHLVDALRGRVRHFLHCGTIWVHGPAAVMPTNEDMPKNPIGDYGTGKAAIEDYLLGEARQSGFPATIFRPGHIVGPGWAPLNPAGHFDPAVFSAIARGDELVLPNFGMETVHHVHADDVAQMVMRAIAAWSQSVGEAFNTVSPGALSLRGYAEAMFAWFGREPRLRFLPFEAWKGLQTAENGAATWEHVYRSPCHSIDKARRLLGYQPRYTSLEAVEESVAWLIADGQVAGPPSR